MVVERDIDSLISAHIEPHPFRDSKAEARIRDAGVSVWALVAAYLQTPGPNALEQVAEAYDITVDDMRAALAYYKRHKRVIDARLITLDPDLHLDLEIA